MADASVQITAGSGTPVDTRTQADGDHRQVMVVGDATAANTQKVNTAGDALVSLSHPSAAAMGIYAGVSAYGNLRVSTEPTGLFSDPFDSVVGLDTSVRWNAAGTVPPTISTGNALLNADGTANASSSLVSKPTFGALGVNFLALGWSGKFENLSPTAGTAFGTGTHRFFGFGAAPTTWSPTYSAGNTTTNTLLNGIGFEIDTDGFMYPVVYDNGTRVRPALVNAAANLNVGRSLPNGEQHQFLLVIRADAIFWYLDGTFAPVAVYNYATPGYVFPDISLEPIRFAQINTGTVTGSPVCRIGAVGVGDTGANNQTISDPTYPWRRARVTSAGEVVTTTANKSVTYKGRAGSFRQLGIAGTAGQKLFSMFNAAGSGIIVDLESITFDVYQTAARVVAPPLIRLHRITTAPTGGTAVSKVAVDTTMSSSASVTLLQGTASDGGAATAIVSTPGAGTIITQEPVARALTLVGYEQYDRGEFLDGNSIILRPGEGVLLNLDYSVATSNPITDNYIVNARWTEYTVPA